ncbi:MAG: hypothetical protein AVDCRST_MAG89-2399, partial [uncultured Gemmatimonadetes bacterium]
AARYRPDRRRRPRPPDRLRRSASARGLPRPAGPRRRRGRADGARLPPRRGADGHAHAAHGRHRRAPRAGGAAGNLDHPRGGPDRRRPQVARSAPAGRRLQRAPSQAVQPAPHPYRGPPAGARPLGRGRAGGGWL